MPKYNYEEKLKACKSTEINGFACEFVVYFYKIAKI
jgi:hypothetical protein